MGLTNLTDKQRADIEAIYEDSAPQFAAIDLEYHDLRRKNWERIQNVLTPDQISTVQTLQHNKIHPESPFPALQSKPVPKKTKAENEPQG